MVATDEVGFPCQTIMKRYLYLSLPLSFSLFLAACAGDNSEPVEEETDDLTEETEETEAGEDPVEETEENEAEEVSTDGTDDTGVDEILERTVEAMSEVENFEIALTTEQNLSMGDQDITTTTESQSQITMNPFNYYEQATITDDMGGEPIEVESYFTEEGFFTYESAVDEWIKLPQELAEDIGALADQQQNPEQQLELLLSQLNTDDLEIEENEDHYVVTVAGDHEGLMEASLEMVEDLDGGLGMMVDDLMSMIEMNEARYEILIDKETYYYQEFNTFIDMDMEIEGDTVTSEQTSTSVYSNFNEVDDITVPTDIAENAQELNYEDFDGDGFEEFDEDEAMDEEDDE